MKMRLKLLIIVKFAEFDSVRGTDCGPIRVAFLCGTYLARESPPASTPPQAAPDQAKLGMRYAELHRLEHEIDVLQSDVVRLPRVWFWAPIMCICLIADALSWNGVLASLGFRAGVRLLSAAGFAAVTAAAAHAAHPHGEGEQLTTQVRMRRLVGAAMLVAMGAIAMVLKADQVMDGTGRHALLVAVAALQMAGCLIFGCLAARIWLGIRPGPQWQRELAHLSRKHAALATVLGEHNAHSSDAAARRLEAVILLAAYDDAFAAKQAEVARRSGGSR